MAAVIGTYNYTYGDVDQPNRQIQFSRTDLEAGTIQAQVFVLNAGVVGNITSTVPGNQIDVEMQSTSQKANAMMLARQTNTDFAPIPDQKLSNLTVFQQNALIGSLGTRHISVSNAPGRPGGLELVTSLTISDPS